MKLTPLINQSLIARNDESKRIKICQHYLRLPIRKHYFLFYQYEKEGSIDTHQPITHTERAQCEKMSDTLP
jgi:hypothetical protein